MTESRNANAGGTWSVPECPFAIEYSSRVLDDIRLAVMDAFFSLPRGGAEIGGVLLGRFENARLSISDYLALDCEHAFGPSFTLSPRDEQKLRGLVDSASRNAAVPVGWYHSHTRSEIFLSEADLEIHKRFFPQPWQVALVMKPHTFQPTRCGFFFREPDGNIQAASTFQEFTLDPLPIRPVPSGDLPLATGPAPAPHMEINGAEQTIDIAAEPPAAEPPVAVPLPVPPPPDAHAAPERPETQPEAEREPAPAPAQVEPPQLLQEEPRSWLWLKVVLAIAVGAGLGAAGFQTRQFWLPRISALLAAGQREPAFAAIGLTTFDADGQLQIHWDRYSPAVRQAAGGHLNIVDSGGAPRDIKLDPTQLQAGNLTYERQGESVNLVLTLDEPDGRQTHEASSFLGKVPVKQQAPSATATEIEKQRDEFAQETVRLRQESGTLRQQADTLRRQLAAETEKNRKLEQELHSTREQLLEQIRRRMGNQAGK
jgi:proteasome lid subunit RPN8/RPN11